MKLRRGHHTGFTLVELLITMGLLSIFMLVITDIFAAVVDVRTESEATSAVSEDSRFLLARLSYDVQRASAVTTPAALGGASGTLGLTIGGVAHTYAVSGGNLQLTNPSADNLNSSETVIS